MKKKETPPRIVVKKEWCKRCSICIEFCPRDVLAMVNGYPEAVNIEACTRCKLCEIRCPDFAITVEVASESD